MTVREVRGGCLSAILILSAASGLFARTEVWDSDRTVASRVEFTGRDLKISPGVKVSFTGDGSIFLQDAALECDLASFEADGVITNRFRIMVLNGRLRLSRCEFRNVRAVTPAGEKQHWIEGGICVSSGGASRIEGCTFVGCSPVMVMNCHGAEIERNLTVGGPLGFSVLRCRGVRIAGNEFYGVSDVGFKASHIKDSELFMNRFTSCGTGVRLGWCSDIRLSGNAFFDCRTGFREWLCGSGIVHNANRFENVKSKRSEKKK